VDLLLVEASVFLRDHTVSCCSNDRNSKTGRIDQTVGGDEHTKNTRSKVVVVEQGVVENLTGNVVITSSFEADSFNARCLESTLKSKDTS